MGRRSLDKYIWSDIGKALAAEAARYTDGVQGYLKKQNSVWNVVGRVCLHLAENKRDPLFPFAFIATYVHKVSKQAKPHRADPEKVTLQDEQEDQGKASGEETGRQEIGKQGCCEEGGQEGCGVTT